MGRYALTWEVEGTLRAASLDPAQPTIIGRIEPADVVIPVASVSRRQALLRSTAGKYTIENLSTTNPTIAGGVNATQPVPLANATIIAAGGQLLRFWDLAAGDRSGGVECSHCGRVNDRSERFCWFCGTALVNAPTTVRTIRQVVTRLVDASGETVDLVDGGALGFAGGGVPSDRPGADDGTPRLTVVDGVPTLSGRDARVERAGTTVSGITVPLGVGDVIRVSGRAWVAIVR